MSDLFELKLYGDDYDLKAIADYLQSIDGIGNLKPNEMRAIARGLCVAAARLPGLAAALEREAAALERR